MTTLSEHHHTNTPTMETEMTYEAALEQCRTVDTTEGGGNGYPRRLRVAHTADTMGELRELKEAAEAAGHEVSVLTLHRRDGWALWERSNDYDLENDRWMGMSERDTVIDIDRDSDREQEAFDLICGEGYEVEDAADLIAKAEAVRELAEELADPDELEDGEIVRHMLDANNSWSIAYTVCTGQNGYSHDTHQYCTALVIVERDEEEEND